MLRKKRGFSAAQSKATSRRMQRNEIGTHIERTEAMSRTTRAHQRHMNADAVDFSSSKRSARAARGVVDRVDVQASSAESDRAYTKRMNTRSSAQAVQQKMRVHRIVVIVSIAAAALLIAAVVACSVFVNSINAKLSLESSDAQTVLVAQTENTPYYILCEAELGRAHSMSSEQDDAFALVRIDEANQSIAVVMIPANVEVKLADGLTHPLYDAAASSDGALISAVSSLAGVSISHFAKTDADGLSYLVELVGGLSVNVTEEVDDPAAGDTYIAAGDATLDAKSALTLLRASNYTGGAASQAANRSAFFCALARRLLEPSGFALVQELDAAAGQVQSDWTMFDVLSVAGKLHGGITCITTCVPGKTTTQDNVTIFSADTQGWAFVMQCIESGVDPATLDDDTPSVDPSSFTIDIRNGANITGAATQLSSILEASGYVVESVGNVDDYTTYPETLVIYKDSDMKEAAEAIVSNMGFGRVVNGGSYYTFDTDILLVIGQDFNPIV